MANLYYSRLWVLRRYAAGPLTPYMEAFAEFLSQRGYAYTTGQRYVREVGRFSAWLHRRALSIEGVEEDAVSRYTRSRWRGLRCRPRPALFRLLLEYLRGASLIPPPTPTVLESPETQLVERFSEYLRRDRGLSLETIRRSLRHVRRFLDYRFGRQKPALRQLRAHDAVDYVANHLRGSCSPGYVGSHISALRSFFRFLYLRGDLPSELAVALPSVASWRHAALPSFLQATEVNALLRNCDRDTRVGRRDYAILLLQARLGLRGIEVQRLCLDDVNWQEGYIAVCGKGGTPNRLPLPQDVGTAIVRYLRNGRPQRCLDRHLFVRAIAPYRGFTSSSAIAHLVGKALRRAGIQTPRMGSHLLRRSCATMMVQQGATLAEVGQILRHQSPDTTAIYAKVDIRQLRLLTMSWPGESP